MVTDSFFCIYTSTHTRPPFHSNRRRMQFLGNAPFPSYYLYPYIFYSVCGYFNLILIIFYPLCVFSFRIITILSNQLDTTDPSFFLVSMTTITFPFLHTVSPSHTCTLYCQWELSIPCSLHLTPYIICVNFIYL